jgi:dihydrofolate reductase/thymidylate synthase
MKLNVIVAYDKRNGGIGVETGLPWKLSGDLKHFKQVTIGGIVVMGRKTWESIPEKHRPLPDRINIIISSNAEKMRETPEYQLPEIVIFSSLDELFNCYLKNVTDKEAFIIGGGILYNQILNDYSDLINRIYTTEVYNVPKTLEYSAFFPVKTLTDNFSRETVSNFQREEKDDYWYRMVNWTRDGGWQNLEELSYLSVLEQLAELPNTRGNRTAVKTRSLFGFMWKYDLRETFPLLTTRRQFTRAIFEELMFYLSGKTDNNILADKNIHIWDGNTTRDFLDSRGLQRYPEGDMGETYGFNIRHFGGKYRDCKADYTGVGYDQLENLIHLLKTDPTSRRMIVTLWNPATLHNAALPSCLYLYQFYVNLERKELNVMINLRSSDYYLANNWNVCTGAFFVHMLCNLNGIDLTPGELTIVTGDTHIYDNHMDAIQECLKREPRPFPKLNVKRKCDNISDFTFEDMEIIGYHPYPNISVEMVV